MELNRAVKDEFLKFDDLKLWRGHQLLGMDGSSLQLPPNKEIWASFPPITPSLANANQVPIARFTCLHDMLNDFTLDARLDRWKIGEREQASAIFSSCLGSGQLVLMDRGYPAMWLFEQILAAKANFCARMPRGTWAAVDELLKSKKDEGIFELTSTSMSKKASEKLGLPGGTITVRLVRVTLDTGEDEVLATSLLDSQAYPAECLKELYHYRWGSEESYKLYKCRAQIENFSGLSEEAVRQDVMASVLACNLAAVASFEAKRKNDEENLRRLEQGKKRTRINLTNTLAIIKRAVAKLIGNTMENVRSILERLTPQFLAVTEILRPGRNFPREVKYPNAKYKVNYKPMT